LAWHGHLHCDVSVFNSVVNLGGPGWIGPSSFFFRVRLVILLLIASVMVLALFVQRLALIQVQGVLRFIGNKGRQVIAEIHPPMTRAEVESEEQENISTAVTPDLPVTQAIVHSGEPMAIAAYDAHALVGHAPKPTV
jgi:hypothetical protein